MMIVDTPGRYLREAEDKFGVDAGAARSVAAAKDIWTERLLSAKGRFVIDAMTAMHVTCPDGDLTASLRKACDGRGTFRPPKGQMFPTSTSVVSQVRRAWEELGFCVPEGTVRTAARAADAYFDAVLAGVSAGIRLKDPRTMEELERAKRDAAREAGLDPSSCKCRDRDVLMGSSPRKDPEYHELRQAAMACMKAAAYGKEPMT